MKFNISYLGPEWLFHLRRDFILVLKYALEDLGHDVVLSGTSVDVTRFNLLIAGYFASPDSIKRLLESKAVFAHVNTEVIGNDMLNFDPKKVDFMGSYLPWLQKGRFIWDVIQDNLAEHERYGNNAHFLPWGWHPRMQDIEHRQVKDLDFYFFGMLSDRRQKMIGKLAQAGMSGVADHTCPYFLRNDRISRAKVQLNLIQEDRYTHVNSFRICYLANNAGCILSENEQDPANYLQYAEIVTPENLVERVRYFTQEKRWVTRGEKALADFRQRPMKAMMEELLEKSFGGNPQ